MTQLERHDNLDELGLINRINRLLKRGGIQTIGDLLRSFDSLPTIRGIGRKGISAIRDALNERGFNIENETRGVLPSSLISVTRGHLGTIILKTPVERESLGHPNATSGPRSTINLLMPRDALRLAVELLKLVEL